MTNWNDPIAAGREYAGNFRKWDSFSVGIDLDPSWTIVYTHSRDSDLLTQSNAKAMDMALINLDGVETYRASHWTVGWVEGYTIRVYPDSTNPYLVTEAWVVYCDLMARIEDYPALDEAMWSSMEREATYDNLCEVMRGLGYSTTRADEVYSALPDRELEDRGGLGGYPSEQAVIEACKSLKMRKR